MREHGKSLHDIGMTVVHAIGDEGFSNLSSALTSLDPDFKRLLVEGAYAGLIARPNLALKHRELITVTVLATMGNADSALKYHAAGMLNTGWTPEELIETVLHTLIYAGVPVAVAGIRIVSKVLSERGIRIEQEARRPARGAAFGRQQLAWLALLEHEHLDSLPRELHDVFTEVVYGSALNGPTLTSKDRQLVTLAIAIALENQLAAVRLHLKACLRLGWTRNELTEVLIQLTGYIGWPLILPITRMALDVFGEIATEDLPDAAASREPIEAHAHTQPLSRTLPAFTLPKGVAQLAPAVAHYLADIGWAANKPESDQQAKARRLSDIACLTCLARNADAEVLAEHVKDALSLGASRQDIVDAILSALPHAGALAAQYGLVVAGNVFDRLAHVEPEERRIA